MSEVDLTTSVWFYSYTWRDSESNVTWEHQLTNRHPLLEVAEWIDVYDGNNKARLVFYAKLSPEELKDPELKRFVDFALHENFGEFAGFREMEET